MKYYFAPMEGITLYPLRNVHHEIFGDAIDKYYTPFLTAHHNYHFKKREKRDVMPEFAQGFEDYGNVIIPQIMSNRVNTFVWAAKEMQTLGYNEINLNLGCPAATVTNRHKGSGLLQDTDYLDEFLNGIFNELGAATSSKATASAENNDSLSISVKTRLGFYDDSEAEELMKVYAKYPISELTIHARVREDFYQGKPRLDAFKKAVEIYRENGGTADICYNGDINSLDDYRNLMHFLGLSPDENTEEKPSESIHNFCPISSVMMGRGLLANPALARELRGGQPLQADELREYLARLYEEYAKFIPEDRNVIFKMLEHWAFVHVHFKDNEKCLKTIRKARSKGEYMAAVNNIFASCEFI
ncbi:tRNA dihydrouridine synthase [Butyrivibrio sp. VCB2006]|uniref:tRNA dihydrouridine synthase n=1 Tax=Butyrivibrio sp. VCB2006 TaxID=1280679 RepID=UPI00041FCE49|nr:tRNA-dihydrouridine synthase family protein [Butyrivibrio sp. VCB2006]